MQTTGPFRCYKCELCSCRISFTTCRVGVLHHSSMLCLHAGTRNAGTGQSDKNVLSRVASHHGVAQLPTCKCNQAAAHKLTVFLVSLLCLRTHKVPYPREQCWPFWSPQLLTLLLQFVRVSTEPLLHVLTCTVEFESLAYKWIISLTAFSHHGFIIYRNRSFDFTVCQNSGLKKPAISRNKSPCLAAGPSGSLYGYFCIRFSDKDHQHIVSMSIKKIKGISDQSADLLFLVHIEISHGFCLFPYWTLMRITGTG